MTFSVEIEYSLSCCLSKMFSSDFVTEIRGDLKANYDDHAQRDVGLLCAIYIDLASGQNEQADLAEILDETQTIADYASALYDPRALDFKKSVVSMFDGKPCLPNLLILDRLEILPEFRGKRIGLAVLHKTIQHFARDCGLVAMKPFPLQFESRFKEEEGTYATLRLGAFTGNKQRGTKALSDYYQILGFRRLKGTPYYLLCPALRNPSYDDLGLPEDGDYTI